MLYKLKPIGSVNSSYYGWVGIPLNYFYKTALDIDRINLKLQTEAINWNSKFGELLEKSLILTDDEKLFGITKTVLELRNYNYVHRALTPTFTVFGLYCSAQVINRRFGLFQMPRAVSAAKKMNTSENGTWICSFVLFSQKNFRYSPTGTCNDLWTVDSICVWNLFDYYRFDKN